MSGPAKSQTPPSFDKNQHSLLGGDYYNYSEAAVKKMVSGNFGKLKLRKKLSF